MTLNSVDLTLVAQPVVVRCPTVDAAERVRADWARCLGGARATGEPPIDMVLPEADDDGAHYMLTTALTTRVIERLVGTRLMLHACGLSTDGGAVVTLVAPSGTGKTTAARMLAATDFGYVSDETVVIDEHLRVQAYPKPLSLLGDHPGKVQRGPDELGLRTCPEKLNLGRLVVLDRQPESTPPQVDTLPLVDAMLELIPQTSGLPSLPQPLQRLARAVTDTGGALRLTYSEIVEAADLVQAAVSPDAPLAAEEWWGIDPEAGVVPLRDGRLGVDIYQDAIEVEGEVLLLVGGVPMRLSGIGATIWLAVRDGLPADHLLRHVVETHGDHPQAAELVQTAVFDLLAAHALARRVPQSLADVMAGLSSDSSAAFG